MVEMEILNKLYLELSQFTTAKTAREIARDAEVREVLEGLMRATSGQPCWCGEGDYVHNDEDAACLAARALWERVQGTVNKEESNVDK